MSSNIEHALKKFLEDMREDVFAEFLKTDISKVCEEKKEKIIEECMEMTSEKNQQKMGDNISEMWSLNIPYADYLYARGISDGMKLMLRLIN